jgi:glutamyl/glutaminyl-tRNA synthetase
MAGFKPDNVLYGSDYFDICFKSALKLIEKGKGMSATSAPTRYASTGAH